MNKQTAQQNAGDKPAVMGVDLATKPDETAEIVVAGSGNQWSRTMLSLASLENNTSHYPEPIRAEVGWLQGFFLDHCRGNKASLRAVAAQCGHDKSEAFFHNLILGYNFKTTYQSGNWKAGGKAWSECMEMIAALRRYAQQIEQVGKLPFVQTPTYHCIADFITAKMALSAVCKFGGITGPTGGQKSACFKHYRILNNHGRVIHVEAPADGNWLRLSPLFSGQTYIIIPVMRSHVAVRKEGA